MTPEEAAWVRENVWTEDMQTIDDEYRARRGMRGVGYYLFNTTPCQLGACPACQGKVRDKGHEDCTTRLRITEPLKWSPDVVYRWDLPVTDSRGDQVADLLLSCRGWVCECGCWREVIGSGGQLNLLPKLVSA